VHLAPALVGPSHPRMALRRLPQDYRRPHRSHRLRPLRLAKITQETDVLDTWFSSGLLPVSVFGWPNLITPPVPETIKNRADFDAFYPTSLLVTGFDILFFWVARMIMFGCWFAGDVPMPDGSKRSLADSVPFREVYIHALVRDANREKMSKTKGNVLDPIEIVKQYGTDAVRFTLASMASPGTDIAFNIARTEGYRAFANKIWNAARFLFMNVDRAAEIGIVVDPAALGKMPEAEQMRRSKPAGLSPNCMRPRPRSISRWKTIATTTRPTPSTSSSGAASAIGIWRSSSCGWTSRRRQTRHRPKPRSPRWFKFSKRRCGCSRPSCPSSPKNSGTPSTTATLRPSRLR
jgi:hypothetical protein